MNYSYATMRRMKRQSLTRGRSQHLGFEGLRGAAPAKIRATSLRPAGTWVNRLAYLHELREAAIEARLARRGLHRERNFKRRRAARLATQEEARNGETGKEIKG